MGLLDRDYMRDNFPEHKASCTCVECCKERRRRLQPLWKRFLEWFLGNKERRR